jgi:hypothetical protein
LSAGLPPCRAAANEIRSAIVRESVPTIPVIRSPLSASPKLAIVGVRPTCRRSAMPSTTSTATVALYRLASARACPVDRGNRASRRAVEPEPVRLRLAPRPGSVPVLAASAVVRVRHAYGHGFAVLGDVGIFGAGEVDTRWSVRAAASASAWISTVNESLSPLRLTVGPAWLLPGGSSSASRSRSDACSSSISRAPSWPVRASP